MPLNSDALSDLIAALGQQEEEAPPLKLSDEDDEDIPKTRYEPSDIDAQNSKAASKEVEDANADESDDKDTEEASSSLVADPASVPATKPSPVAPQMADNEKNKADASKAYDEYIQNQKSRLLADSGFLPAAYANNLPIPKSIDEAKQALADAPVTKLTGVNDYQGHAAKTSIEAMNANIEKESNDANSDISKFARMQLKSLMMRLNPKADPTQFAGLDNMTAAQIEKLAGSKAFGSSMSMGRFSKTEYVTPEGQPLAQSNIDGSLVVATTGEPYKGPVKRSFQPTFLNPQTGERVSYDTLAPQGSRIETLTGPQHKPAQPPPAADGTPQEPVLIRKDLNTEDRKHLDQIQSKFNADKEYNAAKATFDEANQLKGLIQSGRDNIGPELIGAIQNKAVLSSGVKRITDAEVSRMPGGKDFLSRLERGVAEKTLGQLSDPDRKMFEIYANTMIKNARAQINTAGGQYVNQLSSDLNITPTQATNLLGIQSRINMDSALPNADISGGEIKRKTKDGRTAVFSKTQLDKNKQPTFLRYEN